MRLLKIFILITALFSILHAKIYYTEGAEILQIGISPSAMAMAGIFAADDKNMDNIAVNPIIGADIIRPNLTLSYSGFSDLHAYSAYYSQPTGIGVFSLGTTGVLASDLELGTLMTFKLMFAKQISLRYKFGFAVYGDYAKSGTLSTNKASAIPGSTIKNGGGGVDLSLHYNDGSVLDKGIGIGDMCYGFVVRGLGKPPKYKGLEHGGEQTIIKPLLELVVGTSFDFLKIGEKKTVNITGLAVDVNFLLQHVNFKFSAGLRNTLDFKKGALDAISLTFGFSFLQKDDLGLVSVGRWSAGALARFKLGKTDLNIHYAVLPETVGEDDFGLYHNFSLNLAFGKKDVDPPGIDLGDFEGEDVIRLKKKDQD